MMKLIQTLQSKPKDSTIRLVRGLFAALTFLVLILGYNILQVQYGLPQELVSILFIFPVVGLIRAIFDPGVFRRRIWKWTLVGSGVLMILLGWFLVEDVQVVSNSVVNQTSGSGISLSDLGNTAESVKTSFNADLYYSLLGWILLFVGLVLNGKNTTAKNERYGEVIKKIRV